MARQKQREPRLTDDERRWRSERITVTRDNHPDLQERINVGLRRAAAEGKFSGELNPMSKLATRAKIRGERNGMARPEVRARHKAALAAYWAARRAQKESNE